MLDLACGDGALLRTLGHRLGTRAELIGADLSAVDLELARSKLAGLRARLLCEPADGLSLAGESVDAVDARAKQRDAPSKRGVQHQRSARPDAAAHPLWERGTPRAEELPGS